MVFDSIDVVTTATLRPELLELTYRSFYKRLFYKFRRCRLIINIDPLPTSDPSLLWKTLDICHRWFPSVVYRTPETPSFPSAVHWAWSQLESNFCFHLEDDWMLRKHINLEQVAYYFDVEPHLAEVTLNPSRNRSGVQGLALRPSFFRRSFIDMALPLFEDSLDPEKQWRGHLSEGGALEGWHFRLYGDVGDGRYIKEMGAVWRKAHDFRKWRDGESYWGSAGSSFSALQVMQLKYRLYMAFWSGIDRVTP